MGREENKDAVQFIVMFVSAPEERVSDDHLEYLSKAGEGFDVDSLYLTAAG